MIDELRTRADANRVHPAVINTIILVAWIPPLLVLFGIAIAILGLGYRTARYGALPNLGSLGALLGSDLSLAAVGGGVVGFYWLLAHATFGGETVSEATANAETAVETFEDQSND